MVCRPCFRRWGRNAKCCCFCPPVRKVWRIYKEKGHKTNLLPVRQRARGSRTPEVAQKPNTGPGREVSCIPRPPVRKSFISIPITTTRQMHLSPSSSQTSFHQPSSTMRFPFLRFQMNQFSVPVLRTLSQIPNSWTFQNSHTLLFFILTFIRQRLSLASPPKPQQHI